MEHAQRKLRVAERRALMSARFHRAGQRDDERQQAHHGEVAESVDELVRPEAAGDPRAAAIARRRVAADGGHANALSQLGGKELAGPAGHPVGSDRMSTPDRAEPAGLDHHVGQREDDGERDDDAVEHVHRDDRHHAGECREQHDRRSGDAVLRTYGVGAQILRDLGLSRIRVLSAPKQMYAISGFDLEIVEYV